MTTHSAQYGIAKYQFSFPTAPTFSTLLPACSNASLRCGTPSTVRPANGYLSWLRYKHFEVWRYKGTCNRKRDALVKCSIAGAKNLCTPTAIEPI